MCPSIVLNINPVGMTEDEVYAVRDKWIAEYEKYIRNNPVHEELGALLIDRAKRAAAWYSEDQAKSLRASHKNPQIVKLYDDFLGEPNSHKAHELLHTHYAAREKFKD